jgi:DNA-binding PadR family transcriptional regulator
VSESRPRRYYVLSEAGAEVLLELRAEWKYLGVVMDQLLENK